MIVQYLKTNEISYIQGITWTTDAFFRETAGRIAKRKDEGAKIVERDQRCINMGHRDTLKQTT